MENNIQAAVRIEPKGEGNFFDDLVRDYKVGAPIWREIGHEDYWNALEAVPPVCFDGSDFLMGEAQDHTENDVIFAAFVQVFLGNDEQRVSQYYARQIGRRQFRDAAAELRRHIFKHVPRPDLGEADEDETYNEDIEHCENSACGAELEEGRIGYCDECIKSGYRDDEEEGDGK